VKKHSEIDLSEVVRKANEKYLEKLEESEIVMSSERLVEELLKIRVSLDKLKSLTPEEEEKLYRELRDKT